jgi:hypothetical protein
MTLPLKHIFDKMNSICAMPEKFQLQLMHSIVRIELPKNHILLERGQVCDHLYYIEQGILSCHELIDEKEYCSWLMFPGDIATAVESFKQRTPSRDKIRTETKCVLHLLSWKDTTDFTRDEPSFSAIRQDLTDYYHWQAREMDTQRKRPPEDFYEHLRELHGGLLDLLSRKLLASFMGISEPSLYKIISNSRKNK